MSRSWERKAIGKLIDLPEGVDVPRYPELKLLHIMYQNKGQWVTISSIEKYLWPNDADREGLIDPANNVRQYIFRLRRHYGITIVAVANKAYQLFEVKPSYEPLIKLCNEIFAPKYYCDKPGCLGCIPEGKRVDLSAENMYMEGVDYG